jgi:hypothetical protein
VPGVGPCKNSQIKCVEFYHAVYYEKCSIIALVHLRGVVMVYAKEPGCRRHECRCVE